MPPAISAFDSLAPPTVTAHSLASLDSGCTLSVPLHLHGTHGCTDRQPVSVGIPIPKGVLTTTAGLTLRDSRGCQVPVQLTPLARWSDRSVKWLLLDALVPSGDTEDTRWSLAMDFGAKSQFADMEVCRTAESAEAIVVDTGPAVFHVSRSLLHPLARVVLGGVDLLDPDATRVTLTDAKGGIGDGCIDTSVVECQGPSRVTVRLDGTFSGRVGCRFTCRLCFFAGTGLVRVRLTIHNPERARHRGGLWDLGDRGSMFFRDCSLTFALQSRQQTRTAWLAEAKQGWRSLARGSLEIYQDSSGGRNWQSKNHVNRFGRVPCSFQGYRIRAAGEETFGLRASPVIVLQGPEGSLTAGVPEFWQQFPKALATEGGLLHVRLFPAQFGDLFELQGGEQKTHTVWLNFAAAGEDAGSLDWVHQPATICPAPEWTVLSKAIPWLMSAGAPAREQFDSFLAPVIEGNESFFERREIIDEYGWRSFGEVYADHEAAYYKGDVPVISHYNNQYDVINGCTLQYLATADPRWWQLAAPLAQHVIDIDIYHTVRDRAAYNGGLFWHTDHYKDAGTATHRSFSCRNACDRSYGGGPGNTHNYTTGLLHYYYFTGDPQARDAVLSLGSWVLDMDDGSKHILGLVDDGPSGLASHNGEPTFSGPGRGAGNSVNALLDAWLLTCEARYLNKAEELIRRVIHPADDVPARDLLNVEPRWSYTVFLSALARYLDLKVEAGELDFMHAYARASLLRYATWMLEHERPYFDQREKLEFPTEVWAAQEFRKANVFRLAAAHAEEPLRTRLCQRGNEFSSRAWQDLLRFRSCRVARAVAIVLIEGLKDAFLRDGPAAQLPATCEVHDFGKPQSFVYQKPRVFSQLKCASGLARAALRLLNLRHWSKLRYWPT